MDEPVERDVEGGQGEHPPPERRSAGATFRQTVGAVFWSFFGVRRKSDYERDAAHLNPVHVVIAGLIGALIFILILIAIVKSVVK